MTDISKKPRETMIVTGDMPTDYIATNGYEYVLKSKYQSLKEQADKLEKALEFYAFSDCREKYGQLYVEAPSAENKGKTTFARVSVSFEARKALQEYRKVKESP